MAYGNGRTFDPNTKVLSFNLKDKDLPAPIFEVTTKEGDTKVTLPSADRVSGDLIGVRHKENPFNGKVIKSVTVTLKDSTAKEVYFVSIPYTYLGRNIMNSLMGLKSFDDVEISVYKGRPKTAGKPGFSSSATRQHGDLVYGKYEYKDLPAIPKVKVGDQIYSDATAIDAFFKKEVEVLAIAIKSKSPVVANEAVAPDSGQPEIEDPSSQIPF